MTTKQLQQLRNSDEAPFNHEEYTIWLHNKIIESIKYDLWQLREHPNTIAKNGYAVCNQIFNLPSLQTSK